MRAANRYDILRTVYCIHVTLYAAKATCLRLVDTIGHISSEKKTFLEDLITQILLITR
jgi:hypothetical protein